MHSFKKLDLKIQEINKLIKNTEENVKNGYSIQSLIDSLNNKINAIVTRATEINANLQNVFFYII